MKIDNVERTISIGVWAFAMGSVLKALEFGVDFVIHLLYLPLMTFLLSQIKENSFFIQMEI